ncbi:uncharacterized protein [Littorina saxatilis]|uniref:uncharacterized protein n=1 Tax=Littorina saxatilis TaxID=31220 RepID=UPI0038B43439
MEIRREKRSDDVSALQTVVAGLSQQMTAFNAKLTAMQAKLDAANINVAFHAHHSSDPFNVASQGTIVYNVVTTNIGNAYNRNSGYFTAPVSGTYVFFTNCMAVDSMGEEMYIKQDGKSGIAIPLY